MSLRTGSRIGPYRLVRDFVGGANCRWTFAERDGREFFVKEFQRPKYPSALLPDALRTARLARCRAFEERQARLLAGLRDAGQDSGAILVPLAFFRDGLAYYHVAPRVDPAAPSPREIAAMTARERMGLLGSLAGAVAALHARGVVHGDLKPANILLQRTIAGAAALRLIDFDGAFFDGEAPEPDALEFDQSYMAPEVLSYVRDGASARGLAPPGRAADNFSLGLLLHHYWTGRPPAFDGAHRYAAEAADTLRVEARDMDAALNRLMRQALSADPAGRPAASQVAAAIDAALVRLPPSSSAFTSPAAPARDAARRVHSAERTAYGFAEPMPPPLEPATRPIVIRRSPNLHPDREAPSTDPSTAKDESRS